MNEEGYDTDEATSKILDIMDDYESQELSLTQTKYTVESEPVSEDSDLDPIMALLRSGEDPTASNSKEIKPSTHHHVGDTTVAVTSNKEQLRTISKQGATKRFAEVTDAHLSDIKKPFIPENTRRKNKWAYNLFTNWRKDFLDNGQIKSGDKVAIYHMLSKSEHDLHNFSNPEINEILSLFVASLRKTDGSLYKGESVLGIMCGIQRHLATEGHPVDFFADSTFKDLKTSIDRTMQSMCEKGVFLHRKKAEVISKEREEILWAKGILGTSSPRALVDTVFWQNGINFGLRGGMEHRDLSQKNFEIKEDSDGFQYLGYTETVSKTYRGGLKHRNIDPHSARAYANLENPDRCPVYIFIQYVSKLHSNISPEAFYFRPLEKPKDETWFSLNRIGHNKLEGTVKRIMSDAKVEGYFTNHSLRATTATRLFQLDIPEQLIREQTGHRSEAVESHKRTSDSQKHALLRDSGAGTAENLTVSKEKKTQTSSGVNSALNDTGSSTVVNNCGHVTINKYYM